MSEKFNVYKIITNYVVNGTVTYVCPYIGRRWRVILATQTNLKWRELPDYWSSEVYDLPVPPLHLLAFHSSPPPLEGLYRASANRQMSDVYSTNLRTLRIVIGYGMRANVLWKIERV